MQRAWGIQVIVCDNSAECGVHVRLFDRKGQAFAEAPMSTDECTKLIRQLDQARYRTNMLKDF